jgi:triosephosphate isomerase
VRKAFVAGNWKMNGTRESVTELVATVTESSPFQCETLICPPTIFLPHVSGLLEGNSIVLGAQNIDSHRSGAYTGEVSASMVKEFGCEYVLVGHSERRTMFGETDKDVVAKYGAVLDAGLIPILCVGETLDQRNAGKTREVVSGQLDAVMQEFSPQEFFAGIIAYEPVWAIGTGETATPELAGEIHGNIRAILGEKDEDLAIQMRVLYGGSVNPANAAGLMAETDIDGALVGGASLVGTDFVAICKATEAN